MLPVVRVEGGGGGDTGASVAALSAPRHGSVFLLRRRVPHDGAGGAAVGGDDLAKGMDIKGDIANGRGGFTKQVSRLIHGGGGEGAACRQGQDGASG